MLGGVILVLSLAGPSASFAATRTTQPGKNVLVYFVYTAQRLNYAIYRVGQLGLSDLYIERYVVRGDHATFIVINRSKRVHTFVFMKKNFTVKPGRRAHFSRVLVVRGAFPYSSTSDPGAAFKGVFKIF